MDDNKSAVTTATAASTADDDSSTANIASASAAEEKPATEAELRTSKHVYIPSDQHAWIPARIVEYNDGTTSNDTHAHDTTDCTGIGTDTDTYQRNQPCITVSIPIYRNEHEIQSDGGRAAVRFQRQVIRTSIQQLPLQNVDSEGQLLPVQDMVDLSFLHEAAILYNLKARHVQSQPYTRTGDIVIAVNPYKWFHHLYSIETQNLYSDALVWKNYSSITQKPSSPRAGAVNNDASVTTTANAATAEITDPRNGLDPHVYEASSLAYQGLAARGDDQSILVSGESGAGKTETVKICMSHLASIQQQQRQRQRQRQHRYRRTENASAPASLSSSRSAANANNNASSNSEILQRVIDSNPLLEAFGNAKTLRNDNSSRFGKYIQLQFDNPLSHQLHTAASFDDTGVENGDNSIAGSATSSGLTSRQQVLAQATGTASRCILAGSKCEVYLLEKSRVISHAEGERTYHIFYQLLAAPEEYKATVWSGLEDTDNESFCYVGWTDTNTIEGRTDEERFQQTLKSLALVGVVDEKLMTLLRAICIVLQIGNLEFTSLDDDKSIISTDDELMDLAELMGVPPDELAVSLLVRTVTAKGESFQVPLKAETAKDSADAFAKEIYAKIFLWLVRTINDATCAENNYRSTRVRPSEQRFGVIGLLDIFGFETFEVNRFEQLCINYANEKLQQKFTQDIFRSVQTEYEYEGIELGEITYDDNTDVLDLVEGGMGLLALLNEECLRPKGSDKTFVFKAQTMNKDNPVWLRDPQWTATEFGIRHYAGTVTYDAEGFVTKNMDTLPTDLQACAMKSSNTILSKELANDAMTNPLTPNELASHASGSGKDAGPASENSTKRKKKRPKAARTRHTAAGGSGSRDAGGTNGSAVGRWASKMEEEERQAQSLRGRSNLVAETVWTKFKSQLSSLMGQLAETRTRYIRCIKPNSKKRPRMMEHNMTVEQLRCAGVVAAVTISRSAFPNRLDHDIVLERFKSLWPHGETSEALLQQQRQQEEEDTSEAEMIRASVDRLLTRALKDLEETRDNERVVRGFVIGRTRTYFRAGALEYLEGERLKYLGVWARRIQKQARRYVYQSQYRRMRLAALWTQKQVRMRRWRDEYRLMRLSAVRVQCWYRVLNAARTIERLRRNVKATLIQTRWRVLVDSRRLKRCRSAVVVMQSMVRGALQRPKYRQALHEKKEEAKLENQLRALQRKLEEAEHKRVEAEKAAELKALQAVKDVREAEKKRAEEERQAREQEAARVEEERKEQAAAAAAVEEESRASKPAVDGLQEQKRDKVSVARASIYDSRDYDDEQSQFRSELSAEQQMLMDESGKMLEYLRKEVFKLRNQNSQLRTDFDLLKDNNQRLMDANASAGASFVALNQHAKQLSKQNNKLQTELEISKEQTQQFNVLQMELKEELKMKQATYIAEVHSRLQYQKALGRVTDLIQEQCRDTRLVEKVLEIADECEMEYLSGMDGEQRHDRVVNNGRVMQNMNGNGNNTMYGDDEDDDDDDKRKRSNGLFGWF